MFFKTKDQETRMEEFLETKKAVGTWTHGSAGSVTTVLRLQSVGGVVLASVRRCVLRVRGFYTYELTSVCERPFYTEDSVMCE